jgi:ABC-type branched-subunit amino acid transport system substrate-binding protein
MKNIIYAVVIFVVIGGIFTLTRKDGPQETIKIGVVAPLTGPGAVFGTAMVKGVQLALLDLKDTKHKYELVIQDDGTNPGTAASAAQKLINIDKVQAILTSTSGTGNAVSPLAEKAKIPHICIGCSDMRIATGTYNYTATVQVDDEAEVWIAEAQKRGVKTIAMLSQNHPGVNANTDATIAVAKSKGVSIVFDERFDASNRDFKTIISKAIQTKADLYYPQSFPPAIDILGQELKNVGVTAMAGQAGSFTIGAKPEIYNGQWYTEAVSAPAFGDRFARTYPDVRFNVRMAPFGYEMLKILVDGFEGGEDVAAYLAGVTKYDGIVKIYKTNGNFFRSNPGVWTIEVGKPKLLHE